MIQPYETKVCKEQIQNRAKSRVKSDFYCCSCCCFCFLARFIWENRFFVDFLYKLNIESSCRHSYHQLHTSHSYCYIDIYICVASKILFILIQWRQRILFLLHFPNSCSFTIHINLKPLLFLCLCFYYSFWNQLYNLFLGK